MPYSVSAIARRLDRAGSNRFLATLSPDDFARLVPHLRPVSLERGAILHDPGDDIEHVYFPHSGMVSLVAVMHGGATVETMTAGRGGVIGPPPGWGRGARSGGPSSSCRVTPRDSRPPSFRPPSRRATPSATWSCATTIS